MGSGGWNPFKSKCVFGTTLSGRTAPVPGIDRLAGPTIAMVPIRVRLNYDRKIPEYLQEIQDQSTDMIPFEHIGLQNIGRLTPAAQATCSFQNLLVIHPKAELEIKDGFLGLEWVSQNTCINDGTGARL